MLPSPPEYSEVTENLTNEIIEASSSRPSSPNCPPPPYKKQDNTIIEQLQIHESPPPYNQTVQFFPKLNWKNIPSKIFDNRIFPCIMLAITLIELSVNSFYLYFIIIEPDIFITTIFEELFPTYKRIILFISLISTIFLFGNLFSKFWVTQKVLLKIFMIIGIVRCITALVIISLLNGDSIKELVYELFRYRRNGFDIENEDEKSFDKLLKICALALFVIDLVYIIMVNLAYRMGNKEEIRHHNRNRRRKYNRYREVTHITLILRGKSKRFWTLFSVATIFIVIMVGTRIYRDLMIKRQLPG